MVLDETSKGIDLVGMRDGRETIEWNETSKGIDLVG